jgi:hypothetical protein
MHNCTLYIKSHKLILAPQVTKLQFTYLKSQLFEGDTQSKRLPWVCKRIFVADVNVADVNLQVLYDIGGKFLRKGVRFGV